MDILDHMDRLLASVTEQGREPEHWQMKEEDWLEILARRDGNTLVAVDPAQIAPKSYKGIPIEFVAGSELFIVGLMDREGRQAVERR